jgi:hypothetical protein
MSARAIDLDDGLVALAGTSRAAVPPSDVVRRYRGLNFDYETCVVLDDFGSLWKSDGRISCRQISWAKVGQRIGGTKKTKGPLRCVSKTSANYSEHLARPAIVAPRLSRRTPRILKMHGLLS